MIPMLPLIAMAVAMVLFGVDAWQNADRRLLSLGLAFVAAALLLGFA